MKLRLKAQVLSLGLAVLFVCGAGGCAETTTAARSNGKSQATVAVPVPVVAATAPNKSAPSSTLKNKQFAQWQLE
jgi:hypothetical protein